MVVVIVPSHECWETRDPLEQWGGQYTIIVEEVRAHPELQAPPGIHTQTDVETLVIGHGAP